MTEYGISVQAAGWYSGQHCPATKVVISESGVPYAGWSPSATRHSYQAAET